MLENLQPVHPTENAQTSGGEGIPINNELFDELLESVREGGAILRGEKVPSRAFIYDAF